MIVEDLQAKWIFYQMDFISIFYLFLTNDDPFHQRDSVCKEIKKTIRVIFQGVQETQKVNSLFFVEMLFRFPNFSIKENILSNYQGIRPNLKEETI